MKLRWRRVAAAVITVTLTIATGTIAPVRAAFVAPVDQEQATIDTAVGGLAIGGTSQQRLGQTFTAGTTGDLAQVDLPVGCSGTGDLVIEIRDVLSGGAPGNTIHSTTTVDGTTLPSFPPGGIDFRLITLDTYVPVSPGTKLAIVLSSTGTTASDSCGIFRGPVGDSYSGGDLYFDALPNTAGVWVHNCGEFTGERCDLPFRTRVIPPPPPASADVSVTKTIPATTLVFSETQQVYVIDVSNAGPDDATGVTIVDTLPGNVTYWGGNSACTQTAVAGKVTCTLASLASGSSTQLVLAVSFNNAGSYVNSVSVTANETDPDLSDNSASLTTQVYPSSDLFFTTTPAEGGVEPGETVSYEWTVKNAGPDPAGEVILMQTIPSGAVFGSISSPQTIFCGQNTPSTVEYGCRFTGTLPVGGERSMTVTLTLPLAPARYESSATAAHLVSATNLIIDPDPSNDTRTVAHVVLFESIQQTTTSGGTATTDTEADGATPADPIETSVTPSAGGSVSITEQATSMTGPTSWTLSSAQVVVSAPAGTTAAPIRLVFRIDASFLDGANATTLQVFRNGNFANPVAACASPATLPPSSSDPISPDPCVWSRTTLGDGDVEIVVFTSQASVWDLGVRDPFDFGGFLAPVQPGENLVRAGRVVPLKFSLGGFQGMTILNTATPLSRSVGCGDATVGSVEDTDIAGNGLTYDSETDTYSVRWDTDAAWAGTCRELVLQLVDGSEHVARFRFR